MRKDKGWYFCGGRRNLACGAVDGEGVGNDVDDHGVELAEISRMAVVVVAAEFAFDFTDFGRTGAGCERADKPITAAIVTRGEKRGHESADFARHSCKRVRNRTGMELLPMKVAHAARAMEERKDRRASDAARAADDIAQRGVA